MKKYGAPILVAFLIGIAALAVDYMVGSTEAQRKLVSNPTLLDTVTRAMVARETPVYEVENLTTNIYTRWRSGTGTIYIERTTATGNITRIEMTTDTWANRETATYVARPR